MVLGADSIKFDKENNSNHEVEWVDPRTKRVVNELKGIKDKVVRTRGMAHLFKIFEVLDHFDSDLEYKGELAELVHLIGPHSLQCAGEPMDKSASTTQISIEKMAKRLPKGVRLDSYWPLSLASNSEKRTGLSGEPGVYDLIVPVDKETVSRGGAELQQGLAVLQLHHSEIASVFGDTEVSLPVEKIKKHNANGKEAVKASKKYREAKHLWAGQSHLAHIPEDYIPSSGLPSDHNDQLTREGTQLSYRQDVDPAASFTRLLRAAQDGGLYYLDLETEKVLMLDPLLLGEALSSSDKSTKLKGSWTHVSTGAEVGSSEQEYPRFTISAGLHENNHEQAQIAAANGRSTHLSFDHKTIILQQAHLTENGPSTKQAAWNMANALQHELVEGELPLANTLPYIEIRPPYTDQEIPEKEDIDDLVDKLSKNQPIYKDLYKNRTFKKLIQFLGLSNCRARLKEITPDEASDVYELQAYLNKKYIEPKRKHFSQVLDSLFKGEAENEAVILRQHALNIFCPEFGLEDVLAIKASLTMTDTYREKDSYKTFQRNGSVAINVKPLDSRIQLTHAAVPIFETGSDGILTFDTERWVNRFLTEKIHAQFGTNTYNVYKLLTHQWRKGLGGIGFAGAESLGEIFTDKLAAYVTVKEHLSPLGTQVRKIKGKMRYLAGFETADPGPDDEEYANAFSYLTSGNPGENQSIHPRYRYKLNPELLMEMNMDRSDYFEDMLKGVGNTLLVNTEPRQARLISAQVTILHDQWNRILSGMKRKDQNIAFAKLIQANYEKLLDDKNHNFKKALQILFTAGAVRHYNKKRRNIAATPFRNLAKIAAMH